MKNQKSPDRVVGTGSARNPKQNIITQSLNRLITKSPNRDFLIAGVGNEFKEYDKIGIEIARKGKAIYPDKFYDCGIVPENYLEQIVKTGIKTLIIVDAVHYGGNDEFKIILPEELSIGGISTHSVSLNLITEYLKNYGIKTIIIGINPYHNTEETQTKILSILFELIEVIPTR